MYETTYRCRAERFQDACILRTLLLPWLQSWRLTESYPYRELDGKEPTWLDVLFTVEDDGPSYGELLWIVDGIPGLEEVGNSLAPVCEGTAVPVPREPFDEPASPPDSADSGMLCFSLRRYARRLGEQLEIATQQKERFRSMAPGRRVAKA